MGRYYFDKKTETDHLKKVEVWWLKKHGYLEPEIWSKPGGIEWTNGFLGTKSSIGLCSCTISDAGKTPGVEFSYTQTDSGTEQKESLEYTVNLVSTPCQYGGARWWFVCPLSKNGVYCGRRVGVLYLCGKYFGCRHCHELTYSSRNRNRRSNLSPLFDSLDSMQKAEKIGNGIKRYFYAGKPTKKLRRMNALYERMADAAPLIDSIGK